MELLAKAGKMLFANSIAEHCCTKMSSLQVVMCSSNMVRGCLMMVLDSGVRCFGSHKKFFLEVDKRFDHVTEDRELSALDSLRKLGVLKAPVLTDDRVQRWENLAFKA
jgi:hypothetical protein